MTLWQRLMASGDTLLKDGLNDDSFYVSEKRSSAALSGMCLTALIHSCDLGRWIQLLIPPPSPPSVSLNHSVGHQKAPTHFEQRFSFIQALLSTLIHHMLWISQLISQQC